MLQKTASTLCKQSPLLNERTIVSHKTARVYHVSCSLYKSYPFPLSHMGASQWRVVSLLFLPQVLSWRDYHWLEGSGSD